MTAATIYVIKQTQENRYDETAGYLDDAELTIDLEAGVSYWIESILIGHTHNSGASILSARMAYTGALYDPQVHLIGQSCYSYWLDTYQASAQFKSYWLSQSSLATGLNVQNSTGNDPGLRYAIWFSGRITCTTAGAFKIQWRHSDNGVVGSSFPSSVMPGSFLYVTPLDICPI